MSFISAGADRLEEGRRDRLEEGHRGHLEEGHPGRRDRRREDPFP